MISRASNREPQNALRAATPRRRWRIRLLLAAKLVAVSLFLLATGGPSVEAQVDENNPAAFFRLDRQRMQARQKRVIIQRPTRLIRGARPQRGFSHVVPDAAAPAPQTPGSDQAPATASSSVPDPQGEPPATAAATPQTSPPAGPPSSQTAAPEAGIRIVVLGDNVGQMLARGLEATYAERPYIRITRHTRDSSGLVNERYHDWDAETKKLLASGEKIDIAVIMLGSNDNQDIVHEGKRLEPRSEPWNRIYKQRIEAISAQFHTRKIPLIWVGQPIMRNDRLATAMLAYNELYRETVTRTGGIYVDVWEAFIDDRNRFSLFGPDLNGQIVKLRTGDGVHFTSAGARKLAHFAEIAIRRRIDGLRRAQQPIIASVPAPAIPGSPGQTGALPGQPASPGVIAPVPEPRRASAGPVMGLMTPDLAPNGELVTRRKTQPTTAGDLPSSVKRALLTGVPAEARRGRADDFSWPKQP